MPVSLNDLGGGGKSWQHDVGDKIAGTIVSVKRVQQTDFTTGNPLTWSNGEPRMQTVVELQTDLHDSDDDDGIRTLWLKGGKNYEPQTGSGQSGEIALAQAARDAGASSIEEGAKLQFACTGTAKPTTRGFQPAKLYQAKYTAPVQSVRADDLFDD